MTYNLRLAVEWDVHPWSERRSIMIELITDAAPAVLGTQEGLTQQLAELKAGLPPHYEWVGGSRDPGVDDEFCAVFFDTERLELVNLTQRWFSTTPEIAGSINWGRHPRIMTAVILRDRGSGEEFLVINTHLDNWSVQARRYAGSYLATYIKEMADGRPTILMGDFNTAARLSSIYKHLLEVPLADPFDHSKRKSVDRPTFNDHQPPALTGGRIDWILLSPDVAVDECHVNLRNFDGLYPSDHLPVEATVRLPPQLQPVGVVERRGGTAFAHWDSRAAR